MRSSFARLLTAVGGHELATLLAMLGIAAGIWSVGVIADEMGEQDTQSFDRTILLAMRRPGDLAPIGPPFVQEAARDITALGGVAVLGLFTLTVCGFMLLDGKRRMALFVCSSVASGLLVAGSLKFAFNRPRPNLVPPFGVSVSTPSFPSGHSMMAALTYLTLGALLARSQERKRLKAYSILSAAAFTFLVGLSRVYLGAHWPTDIFAGWTAGVSWALICWLTARWLQDRQRLE